MILLKILAAIVAGTCFFGFWAMIADYINRGEEDDD